MSLRARGTAVYLVIAFGTWPYLFFARLVMGWSLVDPAVQLPVAFMPAIGAFVVRRWVTREGFADAGLRLGVRNVRRYWLAAWFAPLAVTALSLVFAAGAGWWQPAAGGLNGIVLLLLLQVLFTPVYMGEEFGWTSFLWPRLIPGRPRLSAAATGLIWAVWHYPLAYLGYSEFTDHTVSMALWTVMFMLFEVMLCWLYAKTGSVWITSLAHAGNNIVNGVLTEQLLIDSGQADQLQVMICTDLALALVCVPLLWSGVFKTATGSFPYARARADTVPGPRPSIRLPQR